MEEYKKVSVIIPVFNSSKTIDRTLNSVLEQDYPSIEIIVIDDGSTDNIDFIIKKYGNKIKYYTQKNYGVSVARNLGFNMSSGDYIQYLDSDDLLAEGKISKQVNALEVSNSDVAYGDWIKFTENDFIYKELEKVEREMIRRPEIELITDFWVPLSALLYSRRIAKIIGGWNTSLPVIQDARYALDAALNKAKFIYTPGVMGYYRTHYSDSLSTRSRLNFIKDCFENVKQIDLVWRNDYSNDLEKKAAVISVLRFCINEFSKLDYLKFNEAIDLILSIDGNYKPEGSKLLILLSQLIGFRNAMKIVKLYRIFF